MTTARARQIELVGRGRLAIGPSDHLATGGEGAIYCKGDTVIKLYLDTQKMQREGIAAKIKRLAKLSHPYLIAPRGLVNDGHGDPIGWYMDYAPGEPIARAFTNDWRASNRFGDTQTSIVADRMLQLMLYAHHEQAVMADANEMNWTIVMARGREPEPRALDIDSWSIGRWPARAIMPSIRDWHTSGITIASDYFAWGIVTFQLYTGLHPYKGTLVGYKPSELERRMRENASVFTPGVRLNRAVRDFSAIPAPLLGWYEATFQQGVRELPPSPLTRTTTPRERTQVTRVVLSAQGALHYKKLYANTIDRPIRVFPCGVAQLASGALVNLTDGRVISTAHLDAEVIRLDDGWLVTQIVNGVVTGSYIPLSLTVQRVTSTVRGTKLIQAAGRLFIATAQGLTELKFHQLGKPILSGGQTWGALASTQWFDGIGVQDTMGATYLIAPFGTDACAQLRVPELDTLRVITAKTGDRYIALVVLDKSGTYRKLELSLSRDYRSYRLSDSPTDTPEINLIALPRGVTATIEHDGELIISVPQTGTVKKVADRDALTTLKLARWGEQVLAIRDGSVVSLSLT